MYTILETIIDDEWYVIQIEDAEENTTYSQKYPTLELAIKEYEGQRGKGYKSVKIFWNLELSREIIP